MNSFLKYNWPSILWAAFIFLLCMMPGRDLPSISLWESDKLGHLAVYMVLSLLTYFGWKKQSAFAWPQQRTFIKVLVLLAAYGYAVEILQEALTADRHFELLDATANAIGAVLGAFIAQRVVRV